MKRFVVALVIFALALATALGSNFIIKKRVEILSDNTRAIVEAAEKKDRNAAEKGLKTLSDSWDKSDTVLHMFVVHREMSEIELNIHALETYLDGGDWELFREESVRISEALAHIKHSQQLNLRNIF